MALNSVEKQLLQEARDLLVLMKEDYICTALASAAEKFPPKRGRYYNEARDRLQKYIFDQLLPNVFLDSWLADNDFIHIAHDEDACRAARIAWVDWMLRREDESAKRFKGEQC